MKKYTQLLSDSLDRYFKTLEYYGYIKDNDVDKLIVLSFLEELLSGCFDVSITESEYTLIRGVVQCLMGSNCLIPYIEYNNDRSDSLIHLQRVPFSFRIAEDTNPRLTESGSSRVTENERLLF